MNPILLEKYLFLKLTLIEFIFSEINFTNEGDVFSHAVTRCLSPGDKSKDMDYVLNILLSDDLNRPVHDLLVNDHAALVMSFHLV